MVDRSSFSSVGSLFHARGAATEKALSAIHRRVHGTMRSPDDEACSADHAGTSATDVSKTEVYSGVCVRALSHHNVKGIPYAITERRVVELIPVLGRQPAGDASHKPGGRLPLLSARPSATLAIVAW